MAQDDSSSCIESNVDKSRSLRGIAQFCRAIPRFCRVMISLLSRLLLPVVFLGPLLVQGHWGIGGGFDPRR